MILTRGRERCFSYVKRVKPNTIPADFFGTKVFFETIEDEEELTTEHLRDLQLKHKVERVVVEYNGMWNLDTFYQNMPEEWVTYQEMMFADARTFLQYNQKHEAAGL